MMHEWMSAIVGQPSDEAHEEALRRTMADLTSARTRQIVELARRLELPYEIVHASYARFAMEIVREQRSVRLQSSPVELDVRSVGKDYRPVEIRPGEIYEIITRPQYVAFRPSTLRMCGDGVAAVGWGIRSFRIGGREQLPDAVGGQVYAHVFDDLVREGVIGPFETAQTAMDIAFLVENTMDAPRMFEAKLAGVAAV